MLKLVFGELPRWAQRNNPLLRYQLKRQGDDMRPRVGRLLMWVLALSALVIVSILYTTNGFQRDFQMPYSLEVWRIFVYPLLGLQLIVSIAAISMGVGAVNDERQRQTWDNLRATEKGAELGIRSRWVAILYRLRGLLLTITVGRIVLLAALLFELTSAQGAILDLWTASAVPSVPMWVGVLVVSAFMTAFLVLPLTATGVDSALGLLIATSVRNRAFAGILQLLWVLLRAGSTLGLFWYAWQFAQDEIDLGNNIALALISGNALFGDWGLLLSQLQTSAQQWAQVPNSIFVGLLMIALIVIQGSLANGMLGWSARIAELRE